MANLLRLLISCLVVFCAFLGATGAVLAHPFGGVEQQTTVTLLPGSLVIEYKTHFSGQIVLGLKPDKDGDGLLDDAEGELFLARVADILAPNLAVYSDDQPVAISKLGHQLSPAGTQSYVDGLQTIITWRGALPIHPGETGRVIRIRDRNFAAGDTVRLNYFVSVLANMGPMHLADDGRELVIGKGLSPGDGAVADRSTAKPEISSGSKVVDDPEGSAEAGAVLDFLKQDDVGPGVYLFGLLTAFLLGALHALSPGHGKAMVAAYLVGTRGRVSDAVRLGGVVTFTHVISVLALGVIALAASNYLLSSELYPWLGVASGILIFGTGYFMLVRTGLKATDYQDHAGHAHDHDHEHHQHQHGAHSLKEIVSLGVAGGLVPCPSAIVILLFAVAIGKIATGLLLILAFSFGLAAVLIAIGIFTVTASNRLSGLGHSLNWVRRLPLITAGVIMVMGVAISLNSLLQAGILVFRP